MTTAPPLPVLIINLPDHGDRFETCHRRLTAAVSPAVGLQVTRVVAVDGRHGRLSLHQVPLTPYTRFSLQHRLNVCDKHVLNTPEAVANLMSHRRCWQTILDRRYPLALVLEDDDCPSRELAHWLRTHLAALERAAPHWDFVVTGYHTILWREAATYMHQVRAIPDVPLWQP